MNKTIFRSNLILECFRMFDFPVCWTRSRVILFVCLFYSAALSLHLLFNNLSLSHLRVLLPRNSKIFSTSSLNRYKGHKRLNSTEFIWGPFCTWLFKLSIVPAFTSQTIASWRTANMHLLYSPPCMQTLQINQLHNWSRWIMLIFQLHAIGSHVHRHARQSKLPMPYFPSSLFRVEICGTGGWKNFRWPHQN